MKYKTALVTGGAGFIGSNLIEELLNEGIKVICIDDLSKGKVENIRDFRFDRNFNFIEADVTDYGSIFPYFAGIEVVFHLACSKCTVCLKDPHRDLEVNAFGTYNVLKAATESKIPRFIHVSTGSVYGETIKFPQTEESPLNPISYYGVSKLAGERYANVFYKNYGLPVTILRYYHVFGKKQDCSDEGGVVAIFTDRLLSGKHPIIYGDGTQVRSFTYVRDTIRATLFVAERENTIGQVYNVASGLQISINKLADDLKQITGNFADIVYKDWKPFDVKYVDVSNKKLKDLGFEFRYSFINGLSKTVEWFKENAD
jgi:UDP-glucose 4-epimerase